MMLEWARDGQGYYWIQAFHIAAVIFWIAGLLMLPRLFAYHHAASPGGEAEEILAPAERRLLKIILNPAMIVAWALGLVMIGLRPYLLAGSGWLHLKLLLVFALSGYHGFLAANARKFASGGRPFTEKTWRMLNEIPAIATLIIVVLAIVKPF